LSASAKIAATARGGAQASGRSFGVVGSFVFAVARGSARAAGAIAATFKIAAAGRGQSRAAGSPAANLKIAASARTGAAASGRAVGGFINIILAVARGFGAFAGRLVGIRTSPPPPINPELVLAASVNRYLIAYAARDLAAATNRDLQGQTNRVLLGQAPNRYLKG